jgi:hypothetical protein
MFLIIGDFAYTQGKINKVFSKYGRGNKEGQLWEPVAKVKDKKDNNYILDKENNDVQKYDEDGNYLAKFGSKGLDDGEFWYPQGLAIDSNENMYIADTQNHRIQKFSKDGKFLMKFGSTEIIELPPPPDEFFEMLQLPQEEIEKLKVPEKRYKPGEKDEELNYPTGITVDSAGFIYVVDMNDARVQKFSSDGKFVKKWELKKYSGVMKKLENMEPSANKIIKKVPDKTFQLGEVYAFPNPAKRKQIPKIHIEVGLADKLEIILYNVAGEVINSWKLEGGRWKIVDNKYCYEYPIEVSGIASGVYIYTIKAEKENEKPIKATGKIAIVK